jgi:hypothetical protein
MRRACARRPAFAALAWMLALVGALTVAPAAAAEPVTLELFKRDGCPRCADAQRYVDRLAARIPELRVVRHDVIADSDARARLIALCDEAGITTVGVPAILVRGQLVVGYTGADTQARIDALLTDARGVTKSVRLPVFGELDADALGLPLFTLAVGLVDGFNPCATWVLLFLLAILVNLHSRAKMLAIGGVFVAVSGVVYYAFMAAWLNLFLFVGVSRAVSVGLGLFAVAIGGLNLKDAVALGAGPSIGIPDAAKPGIYAGVRGGMAAEHMPAALATAAALASLVNLVELLCTAGLPAVYTAVLTAQDLPRWQHYAYLGLYMLAYMLDDALMLGIAVITLGKRKLQARGARVLKLVSAAVMLGLGAVLIASPQWLGW